MTKGRKGSAETTMIITSLICMLRVQIKNTTAYLELEVVRSNKGSEAMIAKRAPLFMKPCGTPNYPFIVADHLVFSTSQIPGFAGVFLVVSYPFARLEIYPSFGVRTYLLSEALRDVA